MSHFYKDIVKIETLIEEMDKLPLSDDQRMELAQLVDSMVHQTVMDVVLVHLNEEDQFIFMEKLKNSSPTEEIMDFLKSKVDNIEEKIYTAYDGLKEDLKKDIIEAQNLSEKF